MTRTATANKAPRTATPTTAKAGKGNAQTPQAKAGKAKAAPATPATPQPRKCGAVSQKAKPNKRMMRVIKTITEPKGKFNGAKRFHLYAKGMTLQSCKETTGLTHLDVLQYVEWEMMTLRDATDKEYEAAVAEWQKTVAPKNADKAA